MKKIYLLFIVLIAFVGFLNAQKSNVDGVWKLTESYEYEGETHTTSFTITFKDPDVIEMSGQELGIWVQNESENTLSIKTDRLFEEIQGENKIETLDNTKLQLLNSNGETTILHRMSLPEGKELNNKFTGEWLLEKEEKDGETEFVGGIMDFNSNGILYAQGMIFGKWNYNKASEKIVFDITEEKDKGSGEHPIIEANEALLVIDVNGAKMYFSKIDHEAIANENASSGLIGTWEFNDVPYSNAKSLVTFKEPDAFTIFEKQEGMESTSNGMWMFNKNDNTLTMIGLRRGDTFNGINSIVKVNKETLALKNGENTYEATKKVAVTNNAVSPVKPENEIAIEHLMFTYDDFFTEDNDKKYTAEKEKLPWNNWREMKEDLLNINQLVYSYEFNDEDNAVFENEILTTDVIANIEDEGFIIQNIFLGYDNSGNPDQGPNTDYNNPFYPLYAFYPLDNITYRVAGNEQITTPAGTFDCTVIEVSSYYDMKKKLWMINDKVGIYAKIIDENTNEDNGYYHLYELQEIKLK